MSQRPTSADISLRIFAPVPDCISVPRLILSLTLAAALFGADAKTAAKSKAPPPAQGTTSQQDKEIEAGIRARLAKSKLSKDGFTVRVQGGVAFWEGKTGVLQHKGTATRMAKASGARLVVNNIQVSDAAKEKAAGNLEQGRRRAQVKRSDPR